MQLFYRLLHILLLGKLSDSCWLLLFHLPQSNDQAFQCTDPSIPFLHEIVTLHILSIFVANCTILKYNGHIVVYSR